MGLFGNIFKPLQGKLTAKQEENMKKVAEVFKEKDRERLSDRRCLENDNKEKTNENCSYILQLAYGLWHRR